MRVSVNAPFMLTRAQRCCQSDAGSLVFLLVGVGVGDDSWGLSGVGGTTPGTVVLALFSAAPASCDDDTPHLQNGAGLAADVMPLYLADERPTPPCSARAPTDM